MELMNPRNEEVISKIGELQRAHRKTWNTPLMTWRPDEAEMQTRLEEFFAEEPEWINHAITHDPALYTKPIAPALRVYKEQIEQEDTEKLIKLSTAIKTGREISPADRELLKDAIRKFPNPDLNRYKPEALHAIDNTYKLNLDDTPKEEAKRIRQGLNFALQAFEIQIGKNEKVKAMYSAAEQGQLTEEQQGELMLAVDKDKHLTEENKHKVKEAITTGKIEDEVYWDIVSELLTYPGLTAIAWHRKAHEEYLKGNTTYARSISQGISRLTGIDIHPGAKIGKNFFIDHGIGTVIGETADIGDNVFMYHAVTLGNYSSLGAAPGERRHPKIGDRVNIGNGATLNGAITIGNDVVAGTNSRLIGNDLFVGDGAVISPYVELRKSVYPGASVLANDSFGDPVFDTVGLKRQASADKRARVRDAAKWHEPKATIQTPETGPDITSNANAPERSGPSGEGPSYQ